MTRVAQRLSYVFGVLTSAVQRAGPTVRRRGLGYQVALAVTLVRLIALRARDRVGRPPRPRTARVLDYTVTAPTSWDLMFLYTEVFVKQEYWFEADTARPFIVDCGGNVGMATLYFKHLYPGAEVLTFEPDPVIFPLLERNVAENHLTGVRLENAALFDHDGQLDFFVDRSIPGGLINSVNPHRSSGDRISVPGVRLSTYLDRPVDLLKVDVEGAEHAVLGELRDAGALHQVKVLVMEYHHHIDPAEDRLGEMLGLLEDAGFGYQLMATPEPEATEGGFQDVAVVAYNKKLASGRP